MVVVAIMEPLSKMVPTVIPPHLSGGGWTFPKKRFWGGWAFSPKAGGGLKGGGGCKILGGDGGFFRFCDKIHTYIYTYIYIKVRGDGGSEKLGGDGKVGGDEKRWGGMRRRRTLWVMQLIQ